MRILLTTLNSKYIHTNLAIRLLYQLNRHHAGLQWKEYTIKMAQDDVAAECAQFEIVCFSCYIWNITQTLQVAEKIKAKNPFVKILLGGPEVSYEWKDIIALPYIDYIITGEGEIPFSAFMNQFPEVSDIPNLVSKTATGVNYLPRAAEFDLTNYADILPYAYDDPHVLRNKILYIETSRGCPYKCEFCLASLDNKVRFLPDKNIKGNLEFLIMHGRVIKFLDRTFNVRKDFSIDIFSYILKHHRKENIFQFEITADIVHPDIIEFITRQVPQGLFRFEIGIQTVNAKANLEVGRKQNFMKTAGIIAQLQQKVEMHLDLIVGLPLDYWEDIKYSFEEVFKLHSSELQLGFLKFLKGTPMRQKVLAHEYEYDAMPPYQIKQSKYLSAKELEDITLLENALEIYWNKKRAVQTLKYVSTRYSIFEFLLGLGKFFVVQQKFHQYQMADVYSILSSFVAEKFAEDDLLLHFIAIDYYSGQKVRPAIVYGTPVSKEKRTDIVKTMELNHHKYRYVFLSLPFHYSHWQKTGEILESEDYYILQYDGVHLPGIVALQHQVA